MYADVGAVVDNRVRAVLLCTIEYGVLMTLLESSPLYPHRTTVTAVEAADALAAAEMARQRSRRAAIGAYARAPLVYWGCAWIVGYAAAQFLPGLLAWLVWMAFVAGSIAISQLNRWSTTGASIVLSGWEGQLRRAWWVILLGTSALPFIIEPLPTSRLYLMFGALWAIGYLLYAVIAEDRALGLLGAGIILLAVVLRTIVPESALLPFGLLAGGGTLAFGVARMRRRW